MTPEIDPAHRARIESLMRQCGTGGPFSADRLAAYQCILLEDLAELLRRPVYITQGSRSAPPL